MNCDALLRLFAANDLHLAPTVINHEFLNMLSWGGETYAFAQSQQDKVF